MLDVRYKKIIFSAKTTTEVWNVAVPVVSGLSTLEPGHTGERRGRQKLAEESLLRCNNSIRREDVRSTRQSRKPQALSIEFRSPSGQVRNVALAAVSGLSTLELGHTEERQRRQ